MTRRILLVFLVFFFVLFSIHGTYCRASGLKYFKNYSYLEDYDHQPQNWGVMQDQNGIIYVANHGGLLTYDGVSWNLFEVPGVTVRSLTIDEKGTVYIGGNNSFGYLVPDKEKSLKYTPIPVEKKYENFSNVWRTHSLNRKIYFRTTQYLFCWDSEKKLLTLETGAFRGSFVCNGELYVLLEDRGLMKMKDGMVQVPNGGNFKNKRIFMMAPYPPQDRPGTLLMGTRSGEFFLFDGNEFIPFTIEADLLKYLKNNMPYHGIRLSSGEFALATLGGGLVIMDKNGNLAHRFDKSSGLQNANVKHVYEDRQGNLWLSLDKGVSRIEYRSPFSQYNELNGLPGIVLSISGHQGTLYAGTTAGLYELDSREEFFQPVRGISNYCWSLLATGDSLLAATSTGVFDVRNSRTIKPVENLDGLTQVLASSRQIDKVWVGNNKKLTWVVRNKNRWEKGAVIPVNQQIRSIAEDVNGCLWLGTTSGEVINIKPPILPQQAEITIYGGSDGLPMGEIYVSEVAEHIVFATTRGVFKFAEGNRLFIPDNIIGNRFMGNLKATPKDQTGNPVFRIIEDRNRNIWFNSASTNHKAVIAPDGSITLTSKPFKRLPLIQVNAIFPDKNGESVWFGTLEGLIRYDANLKDSASCTYPVLLRSYGLRGEEVKTYFIDRDLSPVSAGESLLLTSADTNIDFTCAAPFFHKEEETKYRYFLEGNDPGWSSWTKDARKEYTNLPPGVYTFRVEAQNIYGDKRSKTVFKFKIPPPWYLTWWVYILYAVFGILAIFCYIRIREKKLLKEKDKLEREIQIRTFEIREKNILLEKQAESLEQMNKVKSRFFTNISHEFRTPLTVIMNPLEELLTVGRDREQKKRFRMILRNARLLLVKVNQLLSLSRYEHQEVKLQATRKNIVPLMQGIIDNFLPTARANNLGLVFKTEQEDMFLFIDEPKFEEAMRNLISNALKFTPARGTVTVALSFTKRSPLVEKRETTVPMDFVVISVCDTGKGIPKDEIPYIFDRFFQCSTNRYKQKYEGTGIGLALAKENILLHKGSIDVHSTEDKGSEFVVELPMGKAHLDTSQIVSHSTSESGRNANREAEIYYTDPEMDFPEYDDEEMGHPPEPSPETGDPDKNIILVVEDNPDMMVVIRQSLEPLYTVLEARDGEEGIAKAKEHIPDLIVSDIMMPKVDGYQLSRELKTDIKTSHIPIILLTAKASKDSIVEGFETGADDYIKKPFNTAILLTRIKNLIDLRRQLHEKIKRELLLLPSGIEVSTADERFLKELHDIIEKELGDLEFNIDKLCDKLDMSRSTLFRKVKALIGEHPNELILGYRLNRAAQLLTGNFGTVTEVAMEVGFSTPQYFAKCFREKYNQSPSQYAAAQSESEFQSENK